MNSFHARYFGRASKSKLAFASRILFFPAGDKARAAIGIPSIRIFFIFYFFYFWCYLAWKMVNFEINLGFIPSRYKNASN